MHLNKGAQIDPDDVPPDGQGLARARELAKLFEDHNRRLVSFLIQRLGSEAEAREVAQEAYVRLLQLDQPGAISFLRAYLYKTAANIAVDRIRHRLRVERLEETLEAEDLTDRVSPDREISGQEELTMLRRALIELPERYRRAFLLHRFEQRSAEEIGAELGLKATQVRLYLRRVLAYCRLRLDGATPADAQVQVFP